MFKLVKKCAWLVDFFIYHCSNGIALLSVWGLVSQYCFSIGAGKTKRIPNPCHKCKYDFPLRHRATLKHFHFTSSHGLMSPLSH